MKKIWVERAEVERYIMHEEDELGVEIMVDNVQYDLLKTMNMACHQLQERLEQYWNECYKGGE